MVVGRGNGKLLLFGEHAAVFGYPSLGLQLPGYLEVRLEPHDGPCWALDDLDQRSSDLINRAIDALPAIPGRDVPVQSMRISGDLPLSVGFGSSAAFCTALLRAVDPRRYQTSSVDTLWNDAHALEHVFHGSTASLVEGIRAMRGASPAAMEDKFRRLGSFAETAAGMSGPGTIATVGELAEDAQQILAGLGLSNSALDGALGVLRQAGALGCKLSGAGGGGAFFGVFAGRSTADRARDKLEDWLSRHHPLPEGPFSLVVPMDGGS